MGSLLQFEPITLTQQELVSQNKVSTVYIHKCDLAGGSKPSEKYELVSWDSYSQLNGNS